LASLLPSEIVRIKPVQAIKIDRVVVVRRMQDHAVRRRPRLVADIGVARETRMVIDGSPPVHAVSDEFATGIVVPRQLPAPASGASSRSGTKVSKCKLTAVCQSRQPLSLKHLYRRREVVLPLQWPYASGVESSPGLALLRGDTHRSGNHVSMRRQFGLVLFGDRQDRRSTFSGRSCGRAYR
jgi:hypothetical protein